jgi:hypothetical protein
MILSTTTASLSKLSYAPKTRLPSDSICTWTITRCPLKEILERDRFFDIAYTTNGERQNNKIKLWRSRRPFHYLEFFV